MTETNSTLVALVAAGCVMIAVTDATGDDPMTDDKYAALRQALDAAHEQAAEGKGKERHARDGQDFTSQPIMAITRMVGLGYPCGQAMKKLQEAVGMAERGQHEAARREMLGAINYAAAAWIRVGEMVGGDAEVSDDAGMDLEIETGALPARDWDEIDDRIRYQTCTADCRIEAWGSKPEYDPDIDRWIGDDLMETYADPCGSSCVVHICKRPAEQDDEPPVPWQYAPPRVRYFTRDADGTIDAWEEDRPVLERGAVWCGRDVDLIRWRPGDGDEHEPKIWERPE